MPLARPARQVPGHKIRRGRTYIDAKPLEADEVCTTVEAAIRMVEILGSSEAADWTAVQRRKVARAVTDFLCDYLLYVESVERGCKELLLQAAAMVGKK